MATSPLFGWEEPDDVDLVKDGAAAIRTLGNAIDTSMGDLLGGTTGQVLAKASNTNMDFTWVAQDDSNAIQNAIVDAKGDLIAATAADTPARLAVGANGTVLTADSAEATGLKWATPASGSTFAGWLIYKNATQSIANSSSVFMTWENETYDTNGYHSTSTNTSRATIPAGKAGKYLLATNIGWANGTTGERYVYIWKNGAGVTGADNSAARNSFGNSSPQTQKVITVMDLAEGDYVEVRVVQGSGGSLNTTADECNFIGYLIGA